MRSLIIIYPIIVSAMRLSNQRGIRPFRATLWTCSTHTASLFPKLVTESGKCFPNGFRRGGAGGFAVAAVDIMRLIGNKSRCQLFADSRAQVQCIIAIWLGWQVEFSYYLALLKVNLRQRSRWRRRRRRRRRSNRSDVIVFCYLTFDFCLRLFLSFLSLPFANAPGVAFVVHFPLFPPPSWKASSGSVARQRFIDLQAPRNDSDSNLDLSEDVVGGGRRRHWKEEPHRGRCRGYWVKGGDRNRLDGRLCGRA